MAAWDLSAYAGRWTFFIRLQNTMAKMAAAQVAIPPPAQFLLSTFDTVQAIEFLCLKLSLRRFQCSLQCKATAAVDELVALVSSEDVAQSPSNELFGRSGLRCLMSRTPNPGNRFSNTLTGILVISDIAKRFNSVSFKLLVSEFFNVALCRPCCTLLSPADWLAKDLFDFAILSCTRSITGFKSGSTLEVIGVCKRDDNVSSFEQKFAALLAASSRSLSALFEPEATFNFAWARAIIPAATWWTNLGSSALLLSRENISTSELQMK